MSPSLSLRQPARQTRSVLPGYMLLLGLVALAAGSKAILFDTLDPDCFWHLRVADQLLADGIRPLVDQLSFASIQSAWTPYSWLAELGMRAIWNAGGYQAAVGVQAVMQAALIVLIAVACRTARRAPSRLTLFLPSAGSRSTDRRVPYLSAVLSAAFAAFVSLPYLSFRPVAAALLLLAVCAWLLARDRAANEQSLAVWWLIPLTALIVNVHLYAIFVPAWVAILLAGAIWERWWIAEPAERVEADRRIARYFLLLCGSVVACAATPMLPGLITVALHYQSADLMVAGGYIAEMRPFFQNTMGIASAAVVGLALLCIVVRLRRMRIGEGLMLAVSIVLLSQWGRFAPLFAIVAAPILAVALPTLSDRVLARRTVQMATAVILALCLARVIRDYPSPERPLAGWLNRHGPDAPGYPCAAADFIAHHVENHEGRLVSEFSWAGYLEWRLGGDYKLLLDGRTQLFTPDFWRATYLDGEEDRRRFLSLVRADAAVLPLKTSLFRHSLVQLGWRSVYQDDRAEVLVPPQPQPVANKPTTRSIVDAFFLGG